METVTETKEYTYSDYLSLIKAEEKIIEELDNEIENAEDDLEDVEVAIDLAEAARLSKIRSIYENLVATREAKEAELETLENKLDERRTYLGSLRSCEEQDEDPEQIDREYEKVQDKKIEDRLSFLDDWEGSNNNGKYIIKNSKEYEKKVKKATYFIEDENVDCS